MSKYGVRIIRNNLKTFITNIKKTTEYDVTAMINFSRMNQEQKKNYISDNYFVSNSIPIDVRTNLEFLQMYMTQTNRQTNCRSGKTHLS